MSREFRYLQIAAELRRQIASGDVAPGALMSSESELARTHDASRVTVRRALRELKAEGLVDSRQGFGWYVATSALTQSLRDLTTLERQIRATGRSFQRELAAFAIVATPADLQGVFDSAMVLEITRLDRIDSQPFATATVWVVADLVRDLTPEDIESRPLSEQLGVRLGGATETITAVGASASQAKALGVRVRTPLLHVDRVIRDVAGRPILRSRADYNPVLTEFVVELPPSAAAEEQAHAADPGRPGQVQH
jgi:GntR family transcriptional regulator